MTPRDWFCIGIAFGVAVLVTPLVRAAARRLNMIARPRADRWHKKPTALLGGVGIFAAFMAASLLQDLPWRQQRWLYLGGVSMFCLGLIDDIWRIKPGQKLLGQIIAGAVLLVLGPALPWTPSAFFNAMLTFVWIIGICNAINLLDNMDGLATGVSLIAAGFFSCILWQNDQAAWAVPSAALAAALAGFLVYNSNPASIFMGDSGALFIGYVLSAISLQAAAHAPIDRFGASLTIPVLVLLVPIFDTSFVTLIRKLAGRPASQGGRDHTSHRFVGLGWSERQAVWILYALALAAGGMAILMGAAPAELALPVLFLFVAGVILLGFRLASVIIYPKEEIQKPRQDNL
jgi:UDP-GlcNAc:undecaprenyl-phosphate/decaprenyl-phosphate GlcNAc-1-phosphate transferase